MTINNRKPRREPWPLQDAKAHFSELVEEAQKYGPQIVTKRGKHAVVVLSCEEYIRLKQANTSLYTALLGPPGEVPWEREGERPSFRVIDLESTTHD